MVSAHVQSAVRVFLDRAVVSLIRFGEGCVAAILHATTAHGEELTVAVLFFVYRQLLSCIQKTSAFLLLLTRSSLEHTRVSCNHSRTCWGK